MADGKGHNSVGAGQLRAFVARIERLDEEIGALNQDKSEVYREARGQGFDIKALRQAISERRQDPDEFRERRSVIDLYHEILGRSGTGIATRTRTREDEA